MTTLKIADLNVTAAKIADGSIGTTKIVDGSVTNAKMAANAVSTAVLVDANVTTSKLAPFAVTTAALADLNVTTAKIADLNVTTAKLVDLNVTTAKLAAQSVTTSVLADLNVTTAKIADLSVTGAKISVAARTRREVHTWAIAAAVAVPVGSTDYIPPMFVSKLATETLTLISLRTRIASGTSATINFGQKPAGGAEVIVLTGHLVTTTSATSTAINAVLADFDELRPAVNAVSGSPLNMTITAIFERIT